MYRVNTDCWTKIKSLTQIFQALVGRGRIFFSQGINTHTYIAIPCPSGPCHTNGQSGPTHSLESLGRDTPARTDEGRREAQNKESAIGATDQTRNEGRSQPRPINQPQPNSEMEREHHAGWRSKETSESSQEQQRATKRTLIINGEDRPARTVSGARVQQWKHASST